MHNAEYVNGPPEAGQWHTRRTRGTHMTCGTTLQKHYRGRAQHLQNIRSHVNNVFDAHCVDPIGPATSTTTSQALHLWLGQTGTLRWPAEVPWPLRCGDATPYKPKGPSTTPPPLVVSYSRDTAFRNTHGVLQPIGHSWLRSLARFARSGPRHRCAAELPYRSLALTRVPLTNSPCSASPICPNSH